MKVASLKFPKFEAFKGSEVHDAFKVVGGKPISTEPRREDGGKQIYNCDSWDPQTKNEKECGIYDFCQ
jgi:hypothetical protein